MFSVKTPWSNYSIDVGFEISQPRTEQGRFLTIGTEQEYRTHVIDTLLDKGKAMRKTASIFAWPLGLAEEWATQDISGTAETAKSFSKFAEGEEPPQVQSELFLVVSSHAYDYKQAYQTFLLIHNMAAMAKSSLSANELAALREGRGRFTLHTSLYGVWTIRADKLIRQYDLLPDKRFPDVYLPRAESLRLIAPVAVDGYDGIDMPTGWGRFRIRNGGHIAVAVGDDSADAVQNICTAAKLPVLDGDGHAVLDIYGIEPGFVDANYEFVKE